MLDWAKVWSGMGFGSYKGCEFGVGWIKGLWSSNIRCPFGLFEICTRTTFVTWLKIKGWVLPTVHSHSKDLSCNVIIPKDHNFIFFSNFETPRTNFVIFQTAGAKRVIFSKFSPKDRF